MSQLLHHHPDVMDKENNFQSLFPSTLTFPTEFPYEFDSPPSEAENCDEEGLLARRFAHFSPLQIQNLEKKWAVAGSPQSTLNGVGGWSCGSARSSNGSSTGSSPTTPFGDKNDTWDIIYAAAGQVARMKMCYSQGNSQSHHYRSSQQLAPVWAKKPAATGFYSNPGWNQRQPPPGRSAPEWPALVRQQQIQNRSRMDYEMGQAEWRAVPVQPRQQQSRAMLVPGSAVKRESTGTGVFLPRTYVNAPENRKRAALKFTMDDVNAQTQAQYFKTALALDRDALLARRNALLRQHKPSVSMEGAQNNELGLPQEWTY